MKSIRQYFYPGQRYARHQRAGTQVIAIDGMLRLTYRDPALDWLLNVTSPVVVKLEEGGCHVLPCDTFVEIEAVGFSAVNGLIHVPGQSYAVVAVIRSGIAWLASCVRANAQRSGKRRTQG
ncbi:MAG: hypothetical protein JWR14_4682 [Caballeronia sp.]|jgi:hypothetical protein|uniref:hypothetical protein n=1 Tax=Caballeronia sp. TaxID=1931223 RepID=UPI00260DBE34|nr:hypothetical protein [Caballeronia sp.]MDB5834852.1 hypothetical protein [Caballeronia sp.]